MTRTFIANASVFQKVRRYFRSGQIFITRNEIKERWCQADVFGRTRECRYEYWRVESAGFWRLLFVWTWKYTGPGNSKGLENRIVETFGMIHRWCRSILSSQSPVAVATFTDDRDVSTRSHYTHPDLYHTTLIVLFNSESRGYNLPHYVLSIHSLTWLFSVRRLYTSRKSTYTSVSQWRGVHVIAIRSTPPLRLFVKIIR